MTDFQEIDLYYPEDVCKLLSISLATYNRMCARKEIPAKKVGRRWIITAEKLRDYLNKR